MNPLIKRLAREAADPLEKMGMRLLKRAALIFFALGCLFFASTFLTYDLFAFIQAQAGTTIAGLSVGGLYIAVALICFALAMRRGSEAGQDAARAASAETTANLSEGQTEFSANIDAVLTPILDILREAGLERESLAVKAGAAIAKQLNPFSLVAVTVVAGFILGRALRQRK